MTPLNSLACHGIRLARRRLCIAHPPRRRGIMIMLQADHDATHDDRAGDRAYDGMFATGGAAGEQHKYGNHQGFHYTSLLNRSGGILSCGRPAPSNLAHVSASQLLGETRNRRRVNRRRTGMR